MTSMEPRDSSEIKIGPPFEVESVHVSMFTDEQRERLKFCPRCGAFGDADCWDLRYQDQPYRTTQHRHRDRPAAGQKEGDSDE